TITDDPEKFIEDGGWEFLNMEVSDSGFDSGGENCHPAAHTSLLQCRNSDYFKIELASKHHSHDKNLESDRSSIL
ncbi:hypothetical protein MKW92_050925, partial [Papaver armeniacum]